MNIRLQFFQGTVGIKIHNEVEFNSIIKFLEINKLKDDSFVANTTWDKLISLIELPINKSRFGGFKNGYIILYLHYEHGLCYYLDETIAFNELNAIYTLEEFYE